MASGNELAEHAAGPGSVRHGGALARHSSLPARIHRWAGLTVGLIISMAGLTGSYLAFYPEIETATIAPLQRSAGMAPDSYERVYQALTEVASSTAGWWNIEMPIEGGVITGRFFEGDAPIRMVSVDPLTLEVVRDVQWGSTASTWIYDLHVSLLMGRSGAVAMAVLGIAAMVMIFAGLVLWWRSGRTVRSRFRFDRKGSGERKLYDAHRLLGVGSAALLVVSIAAATAINLPEQVRAILTVFSPVEEMPDPRSGKADGRERLPLDAVIARARASLPQAHVRWIQMPGGQADPFVLRIWQPGEPSYRFPKSYLWLDQYDGRVLGVHHGPQGTATDRILDWLYPLHSGQAFGLAGRAVVALLGLVPAILFVTGTIRWRRKSVRLAVAARHRAGR